MAIRPFTVNMPGNKPFTFRWDEDTDGPITKDVVDTLWDTHRGKTMGPPMPDYVEDEPEEAAPSADFGSFQYTGKDFGLPEITGPTANTNQFGGPFQYTGEDYIKKTTPSEQSWGEWATTSLAPERKTYDPTSAAPMRGLQRAGDWAYEKLGRPLLSPLGLATLPVSANPIGRMALAGAGTYFGMANLPEAIERAEADPTFENVADIGLDIAGMALPISGVRGGWFNRAAKPPIQSVGSVVEKVATPYQRKLPPSSLTGQKLLMAENPRPAITLGEVEPPPPIQKLTRLGESYSAGEIVPTPQEILDTYFQSTTPRPTPTVGGMGTYPGRLIEQPQTKPTRKVPTPEPVPPVVEELPRIGGKGEYGVRGTPFFPTVPERLQTSTTQEMFAGLGRRLEPEGVRPPRSTAQTVTLRGEPVVETLPTVNPEIQAIRDAALANVEPIVELKPGLGKGQVKPLTHPGYKYGVHPITGEPLPPEMLPRMGGRRIDQPLPEVDPFTLEKEVIKGRGSRFGSPTDKPVTSPLPRKPIIDITPRSKAILNASKSPIPEISKAAAQVQAAGVVTGKTPNLGTRVAKKVLVTGSTQLEKMGATDAARLLKRTRSIAAQKAGAIKAKWMDEIEAVTDAEVPRVAEIVESKGKIKDADPRINRAANAVRQMMDETGAHGETSGMEMANPKGEVFPFKRMKEGYWPHTFKEGFNTKDLHAKLVAGDPAKGIAPMSAKEADFVIEHGVKKGKRLIDPQHMRTMNIQGYETTKQALYEHVDDLMLRAEEARILGKRDVADPNSPISQALLKASDPKRALQIVEQQLGRTSHDPDYQRLAHNVGTYQATTKLPFFTIGNANQAAAIGLRNSLANTAKALIQTVHGSKTARGKGVITGKITGGKSIPGSKQARQQALESGAIETVARATYNEVGQNWLTKSMSKLLGWSASEDWLRSWGSNAGRLEAETQFNLLKKNPKNPTAKAKLDNLLLEDPDVVIKQDKLSKEQSDMAGFRGAETTQGLVEPMDLPPLFNTNPLWKIPLMFKRFGIQGTKIVKDAYLMEKTPAEKAKFAVKLVSLYGIMGELTQDTKTGLYTFAETGEPSEVMNEIMKRGEEGLTDIKLVNRLIEDMMGAYAAGIISDAVESLGSDDPGRFAKSLLGPTLGQTIPNVIGGGLRSLGKGVEAATKGGISAADIAEPFVSGVAKEAPIVNRLYKGWVEPYVFPKKSKRKPKSMVPSLTPSMPRVQ